MKNNKGYTLIEVIVATSIVFFVVSTIIPIQVLLKQERKVLEDRRNISIMLHDALQHIIWEGTADFPPSVNEFFKANKVDFHLKSENAFVKGCATWKNAKKRKEKVCLYGIHEE